MRVRRTLTAIISVSALTLVIAPPAVSAGATPTGVASAVRWYEGKTGTVQWAIGSEFLAQLDQAGAVLSFCSAAKIAVDESSGVTIVTMPAHGSSAIRLNARDSSMDGSADCAATITGNNTSVELTTLGFDVASAYPSGISASVNDERAVLGSGARMKLPKQAVRNKITVVSPVLLVDSTFADLLRGPQDASGAYTGPVPTMTTEPTTLGLFQLSLKVKVTKVGPMSSGNSEG
ncbi:MAG: hypothetical protein IPO93_07965 [Actinobacteria bacterium]|nr:hypothetical protein [Actinomycetota bacterium]